MENRKSIVNGAISDHRNLNVWVDAVDLATEVYNLTTKLPVEEKYGLCSQMRRAAVSIASNIAEGAARGSRKDYIRYLYFSSGSASELNTQLIILKNIGIISEDKRLIEIHEKLNSVIQMIHGLIRALRK